MSVFFIFSAEKPLFLRKIQEKVFLFLKSTFYLNKRIDNLAEEGMIVPAVLGTGHLGAGKVVDGESLILSPILIILQSIFMTI